MTAISRMERHNRSRKGPYNAITDVSGISVGHYSDIDLLTGVTVVLAEEDSVGGVDVRGGSPGTRETDLLSPVNRIERVDAVALCGSSAFGLNAVGSVMHYLEERGIGTPQGRGSSCPSCRRPSYSIWAEEKEAGA